MQKANRSQSRNQRKGRRSGHLTTPEEEEFNHRLHRSRNKIAGIIPTWYFAGLLLFYSSAWFDIPKWMSLYYIWNKGLIALLLWFLYLTRRVKPLLVVTIYATINFVWEIAVVILGWDINSTPILDTLFVITLITVIYLTLKEWKQEF